MKVSDADLIAYLDGALDEQQLSKLLQASEHDSDLAQTLAALDASRLPYEAAYAQQSLPELPAALNHRVAQLLEVAGSQETSRGPFSLSRTGQGVAAAVLAISCLATGYLLGNGQARVENTVSAELPRQTDAIGEERDHHDALVRRVADYQSLYAAATVEGIDNGEADARIMMDRLRKTGWTNVGVPDLSDQGYEFVRAQQLGFNGRPLVQLVYKRPGSAPLALCYMPITAVADKPIRHEVIHGLGTLDWIADGQSFVLVADESEDRLRLMHEAASAYFL